VIYHYCVIVEMFCIGLYARHTFRKVEPSAVTEVRAGRVEQAVEVRAGRVEQAVEVRAGRVEKGVQTDGDQMTRHRYSSDGEDSLCRIEHAPLEEFSFPQVRGQQPGRSEPEPGLELTHTTVRPEVNYEDSKDVTVV